MRRHARGCDAAATAGRRLAAAQEAQPNLGSIAPRRRRRGASPARERFLGFGRRPARALYVQRFARDAAQYAKLSALWRFRVAVSRCSGILLRVAHPSGAQDDPSGSLVRGEASALVPFWYFLGGGPFALSRAALATGSATNRSLRHWIATQNSVGHEETRMPVNVGRSPAPRASRSRRSRWSRWPAVVPPSRRRRTCAGNAMDT